jgi:hypothetical protein
MSFSTLSSKFLLILVYHSLKIPIHWYKPKNPHPLIYWSGQFTTQSYDGHDITEILLKVALNTITLIPFNGWGFLDYDIPVSIGHICTIPCIFFIAKTNSSLLYFNMNWSIVCVFILDFSPIYKKITNSCYCTVVVAILDIP